MTDRISILADSLDAISTLAFVSDPAAGAIDIFLGTTRAERSADGRAVVALDYEAYVELAEKQLRELAAMARARFAVQKIAILHRIGRVNVGEASVMIAVSSPHRADAFEACRFLIDELKKGRCDLEKGSLVERCSDLGRAATSASVLLAPSLPGGRA